MICFKKILAFCQIYRSFYIKMLKIIQRKTRKKRRKEKLNLEVEYQTFLLQAAKITCFLYFFLENKSSCNYDNVF